MVQMPVGNDAVAALAHFDPVTNFAEQISRIFCEGAAAANGIEGRKAI